MNFRRRSLVLTSLFGAAFMVAQAAAQNLNNRQIDGQQKLAESVTAVLLSLPEASRPAQTPYAAWPPRIIVEDSDELKASAQVDADCKPAVHLSSALIAKALENNRDRMALVLGHELSHFLLGHVPCNATVQVSAFTALAYTREQEREADRNGLKLLLAAGYTARVALGAFQVLDKLAGNDASFESLTNDHPSIPDRLAELEDKDQAELWKSMSAFNLGTSFLASEQFRLAAASFQQVVTQYPSAWDASNNLGYSLLMQYVDGLRAEDVTEMQLNQVAAGGFFRTSEALRSLARGQDISAWKNAVAALNYANKLNGQNALIEANLGLAYTVAPDAGDVPKAIDYLKQAITHGAGGDGKLLLRAQINLAVAYRRMGREADAERILAGVKGAHSEEEIAAVALRFNRAMSEAEQTDAKDLNAASEDMMAYMQETGPLSPWRPAAYQVYQKISAKQGVAAKPASTFDHMNALRPVVSLGSGSLTVYLGQPIESLRRAIGEGVRSDAAAGTRLERYSYPARGFDVIADGTIVAAIICNRPEAVPVELRSVELGATAHELRVGMARADWEPLLKAQNRDAGQFLDSGTEYLFIPEAGLALRLAADGALAEIVIVQMPQDSGA
jgi:tetratricopeptide (TPR) repeat protein